MDSVFLLSMIYFYFSIASLNAYYLLPLLY